MNANIDTRIWIAALLLAAGTFIACQPKKAAVELPEPRSPDWDSGLSVAMTFDVSSSDDLVEVTANATATNVTKNRRDLCVNLHFIAGFRESQETGLQNAPPEDEPDDFQEIANAVEIATSPWRRDGKSNCTSRSLEPGGSFLETFRFEFSKSDFADRKGDVVVMCQVWFQTRLDIPDRSLTCDLDHYAYETVPVP